MIVDLCKEPILRVNLMDRLKSTIMVGCHQRIGNHYSMSLTYYSSYTFDYPSLASLMLCLHHITYISLYLV